MVSKKKNEQAQQKSKRDKGDTYIPIDTISRKETVKERERYQRSSRMKSGGALIEDTVARKTD